MAEAQRDEIAKLEALYAANPEGRVFAHLAEAYRKAGELDHARDIVRAGLERHPDFASAYVVLGKVENDRADHEAARQAFSEVLQRDGGNLIALQYLAELALERGNPTEALGHYSELLNRDLTNSSLRDTVERLRREVSAVPEPEWSGAEPVTATSAGAVPADSEVAVAPDVSDPGAVPDLSAVADLPAQSNLAAEPDLAVESDLAAEPELAGEPDLSSGLEVPPESEVVAAAGDAGESAVLTESGAFGETDVWGESSEAAPQAMAAELLSQEWLEAGAEPLSAEAEAEAVTAAAEAEEAAAAPAWTVEAEGAGAEEVVAETLVFEGPESDSSVEASQPGDYPHLELDAATQESGGAGTWYDAAKSDDMPADAWPDAGEEAREPEFLTLDTELVAGAEAEDTHEYQIVAGEPAAPESELPAGAPWLPEDGTAASTPWESVPDQFEEAEAPLAEPEDSQVADDDLVVAAAFEGPAESVASLPDLTSIGDFQALPESAEPERPAEAETAVAAAAPSEESGLLTETMAELYRRQGFPDRAAEVYRSLLERDPENARVQGLLSEVESEQAAAAAARAESAAQGALAWLERVQGVEAAFIGGEGASASGDSPYSWDGSEEPVSAGPPIREYFRTLLAWRPTAAPMSPPPEETPSEVEAAELPAVVARSETGDLDEGDPAFVESDYQATSEPETPAVQEAPAPRDAYEIVAEPANDPAELLLLEEVASEQPDTAAATAETLAELEPEETFSGWSPADLDVPPGVSDPAAATAGELMPWEFAEPAALSTPTEGGEQGAAPAPGEPPAVELEAEDEDLEIFRSWLQSLKK